MITDAYDLLAPFAVHLNWSSHQHTLLIFQLLILTTLSLFFIAPYLPYRWILLVAGEGAFLLNHPWTQPLLTQFSSRFLNSNTKQGRRLQDANRRMVAQLNEWIKMDQLPDDVWTRGWRDVEVYENERFVPARGGKSGQGESKASGWSGHHLRLGERRVSLFRVAYMRAPRTRGKAIFWSNDMALTSSMFTSLSFRSHGPKVQTAMQTTLCSLKATLLMSGESIANILQQQQTIGHPIRNSPECISSHKTISPTLNIPFLVPPVPHCPSLPFHHSNNAAALRRAFSFHRRRPHYDETCHIPTAGSWP